MLVEIEWRKSEEKKNVMEKNILILLLGWLAAVNPVSGDKLSFVNCAHSYIHYSWLGIGEQWFQAPKFSYLQAPELLPKLTAILLLVPLHHFSAIIRSYQPTLCLRWSTFLLSLSYISFHRSECINPDGWSTLILVNGKLQAWNFSIKLTGKKWYFPKNKYYRPFYTTDCLKVSKNKGINFVDFKKRNHYHIFTY